MAKPIGNRFHAVSKKSRTTKQYQKITTKSVSNTKLKCKRIRLKASPNAIGIDKEKETPKKWVYIVNVKI